jgi:tetratricopeptide (TPR) repeat protein
MQENLQNPDQKSQLLEKVEIASVVGSVIGAVASVALNQAAVAAIPLSVTVALNLAHRRILLESMKQNNYAAIAQVIQENVKTQIRLESLTEQQAQFEQQTHNKHTELHGGFSLLDEQLKQLTNNFSSSQDTNNQAIAQLKQEDSDTCAKLEPLNVRQEKLQQQTDKLVQEQSNKLMNEQAKIAKTVDALREIETCTQSIRLNPISANAFFNRGLSYQRLGDKEAAIGDYTEAIRVNSNYAEAYQSRGLAYADLGNKKAAMKDLREAARLFFESGEIDKYQIARDLSKKFHDLNIPETELDSNENSENFESIALDSLFS